MYEYRKLQQQVKMARYMLVWFLAAKKTVWLKVGLGLGAADALALLALVLWMDDNLMNFSGSLHSTVR